jgi:hypothetical protein
MFIPARNGEYTNNSEITNLKFTRKETVQRIYLVEKNEKVLCSALHFNLTLLDIMEQMLGEPSRFLRESYISLTD